MLRENDRVAGNDVEHAVDAFDEFGLLTVFRVNCGRQTGGPREIVSAHAVGNGDAHDQPPDPLNAAARFDPSAMDGASSRSALSRTVRCSRGSAASWRTAS